MNFSELNYELPDELIARFPAEPRDHSRLMAVDRATGEIRHYRFHELRQLLRSGDLLIANNTRVIPARLFGTSDAGRRFEVFLLEAQDALSSRWSCLARPGKKVKDAVELSFPGDRRGSLRRTATGFEVGFDGVSSRSEFLRWLETAGEPGLPPYLKRQATEKDRETYQTIFARHEGSVAAPTAGLHFTPELLRDLGAMGVTFAEVTLHVGYGTFAMLPAEPDQGEPVLHEESYEVPDSLRERIAETRGRGGRVIAVGTTTMRALESARLQGNTGRTRLFIRPGHQFGPIDGLITNFHLPGSSLLLLVGAFLGTESARRCYATAVSERYRFYSYGDAMLIL